MYNFFEATGAKNSPMFLNFRPFKLDLSPVMETDQMMAGLAADIRAKRDAQAKAIRDLAIPEWDGNSPDLIQPTSVATGARQQMLDRLNSGLNPFWVAQNDPEFRAAQQQYTAITSPVTQKKLLEEKKDKEFMQQILESRKDEGAAGMTVFDKNGMAVVDPLTPRNTITAGDWIYRRENVWDVWSGTVPVQGQSAVIPSIKSFDQTLKDTFDGIGISAYESNVNGAAAQQGWERLRQATENPMGQVAAEIMLTSAGKSNQNNLMNALEASMSRLSPQNLATIQQMYMQSPEYSQRIQKDPNAFLTQGQFDPGKLYNAALAEASFDPAIGKGKVSFAQKVLLDRVATMLVNENKLNANLLKATPPDNSGGSGNRNSNGQLNIWTAYKVGIPADRTGTPNGRETNLSIPIAAHDGEKGITSLVSGTGVKVPFPPNVWRSTMLEQGLLAADGTAVEKPVDEVFSATNIYMPGGAVLSDETRKHLKISGNMSSSVYYLPEYWSDQDLADVQKGVSRAAEYGITYKPDVNGKGMVAVAPQKQAGDMSMKHKAYIKVKATYEGPAESLPKDWALPSLSGSWSSPGLLNQRAEASLRRVDSDGAFVANNEDGRKYVYDKDWFVNNGQMTFDVFIEVPPSWEQIDKPEMWMDGRAIGEASQSPLGPAPQGGLSPVPARVLQAATYRD